VYKRKRYGVERERGERDREREREETKKKDRGEKRTRHPFFLAYLHFSPHGHPKLQAYYHTTIMSIEI
jgi:hypothetical protein